MLQITDPVLQLLKEALASESVQAGNVFRLEVRDQQFVLAVDQPNEDDITYAHEGTTVLAASSDVAGSLLGETTIDIETTQEGPKLVLVD